MLHFQPRASTFSPQLDELTRLLTLPRNYSNNGRLFESAEWRASHVAARLIQNQPIQNSGRKMQLILNFWTLDKEKRVLAYNLR